MAETNQQTEQNKADEKVVEILTHYSGRGSYYGEEYTTHKLALSECKNLFKNDKYNTGDGDETGSYGVGIILVKFKGIVIYSQEWYYNTIHRLLLDSIPRKNDILERAAKEDAENQYAAENKLNYEADKGER
jgi:hypothetical protein